MFRISEIPLDGKTGGDSKLILNSNTVAFAVQSFLRDSPYPAPIRAFAIFCWCTAVELSISHKSAVEQVSVEKPDPKGLHEGM